MAIARRARGRSGVRALRRRTPGRPSAEGGQAVAVHPLLKLQRLVGNRTVQRLIAQREPEQVQREAQVAAAPSAFATITLDTKGKLRGGSKAPGHEGKIEIHSFHVEFKRNLQGRGASDEEAEAPTLEVTATKAHDDVSALLARAATEGDRVVSVTFETVKPDEKGNLVTAFTLELTDGFISNFSVADETETFTISGKRG